MNTRRFVLLAATLASLSGCSEPFAPLALRGTFEQADFPRTRAATATHLFEGVSRRLEVESDLVVLETRTMVTDLATLERRLDVTRLPMTWRVDGSVLVTRGVEEGPEAMLFYSPDFRIRSEDELIEVAPPGGATFRRVNR